MKKNIKNTVLVSVYGSLRRGCGNHHVLDGATYKGEFTTEPIYSLYSLGGFPGLKQNGTTAVVMEVYECDETIAARVDRLEGYTPESNNNWFYDKIQIQTPFGEAGTYIYVPNVDERKLVESGDWKNYKKEQFFV